MALYSHKDYVYYQKFDNGEDYQELDLGAKPEIIDKHGKSVLSYGDIIKTGTLKKLSKVFKIKKYLTVLSASKI